MDLVAGLFYLPSGIEYLLNQWSQQQGNTPSTTSSSSSTKPITKEGVSVFPERDGKGDADDWDSIAIVGMSCRFPGKIETLEDYWNLLLNGGQTVGAIPGEKWSVSDFYDPDPHKAGTAISNQMGSIVDNDKFDNGFFNITPREARNMDPQQRHLLTCSFWAFEDAGIPLDKIKGSNCGMFVGASFNDYAMMQVEDPQNMNSHVLTGVAHSVCSNRLSFFYGCNGPSFTIDTACASTVTALYSAIRSLREKECDFALVGGVNGILIPEVTCGFSSLGVMSADGRCKPFDARANGYVRSEGYGCLVLKPLAQAVKDGDRIYSIFRECLVNANGDGSDSVTMPSSTAQALLVEETYKKAHLPRTLADFVEAHGTGTAVGDPIEAFGIGLAFGSVRKSAGLPPIRIGSVKSNVGHMEAAAGVASLIKACLMCYNETFVPNANFISLNPKIDPLASHLKVQDTVERYANPDKPMTVSVNSFGFGGANAHAIVQHFRSKPSIPRLLLDGSEVLEVHWSFGSEQTKVGIPLLVPLSARTKEALVAVARQWKTLSLHDHDARDCVSFLTHRRTLHGQRLAVVATSSQEFRSRLESFIGDASDPFVVQGKANNDPSKICFVFSGQGPQWIGMGREFFSQQKIFRDVVLECDALFTKASGFSFLEKTGLLVDESFSFKTPTEESKKRAPLMDRPDVAQVAICFFQIAVFRMLVHWGITPTCIVGHSVGEVAAAYAAGCLSLEDTVTLIHIRSMMQQKTEGRGKMLAVACSPDEAKTIINSGNEIWVAAVNSPTSVTIAGSTARVNELRDKCKGELGFRCALLGVGCAYHTPQMDPIKSDLLKGLAFLNDASRFNAPSVPLYSTVTGKRYVGPHNAEYWWLNVRQPVLFMDAVNALHDDFNCDAYFEIAPRATLGNLLLQCLNQKGAPGRVLLSCCRKDVPELAETLASLGKLYTLGHPINWTNYIGPCKEFCSIPLYPFVEQAFWQEPEVRRNRRLGLTDRSFTGRNGKIDVSTYPWLQDHVVQGSIIFPGAGYIELAAEFLGDASAHSMILENIRFLQALVVPKDGSVSLRTKITGKDRGFEIVQEMTVHCAGQLAVPGSSLTPPSVSVDDAKGRCQREVLAKPEVYSLYRDMGFSYGPAHQGITELWKGDEEAVGFVNTTVAGSSPFKFIHPAILDACIQVMLGCTDSWSESYIPSGCARVELCGRLPEDESLIVHARVVAPLTADIIIYSLAGQVLASLLGFSLTVVKPDTHFEMSKCLWQVEYQEKMSSLPVDVEAKEVFAQDAKNPKNESVLRVIDDVTAMFNKVVSFYCFQGLKAAGAKIDPKNNDMFINSTRRLASKYVEGEISDVKAYIASILEKAPFLTSELHLIQVVGENMKEILCTQGAAIPLLYHPDALSTYFSSSFSVEGVYETAAKTVCYAVRNACAQGRVVRILEVGGRMGAMARKLTQMIASEGKKGQVEYIFTDLTTSFFPNAQRTLHDCDWIHYKQLDIEKDIVEQGFEPHSCDIVLVVTTLHTVVNLPKALLEVERLIAPGGWLINIEPTNILMRDLENFIFGPLEIWWQFNDFRRDPSYVASRGRKDASCCLEKDEWVDILGKRGYDIVEGYSTEPEFIFTTIIARKSLTMPSSVLVPMDNTNWLVFDSGNGVGELFAAEIKAKSGICTLVPHTGQPIVALREAVHHHLSRYSHFRVLYLWSTLVQDICAEDSSLICLLELFKALKGSDESGCDVPVYVVTEGAQVDAPNPNAATFVGMCRTAGNEMPRLPMFVIDLDLTTSSKQKCAELLKYISGAFGTEREVVYRSGHCIVPRIKPLTLKQSDSPLINPSTIAYRLDSDGSGTLEGLAFTTYALPSLKSNEVRIHVQYAGLNFKDVMMSLNMLKGLGEAKFGLGCVGVISEIGSSVKKLSVGQRVVAFADNCFGSSAFCSETLVTPVPATLDGALLSLIPLYVTAYHALVTVGKIKEGETVLIHSAASGVGQCAIQIAQAFGATVYCTVGTKEKRLFLEEEYGLNHIADSRTLKFVDDVLEWSNGAGVDLVLNSLTGEAQSSSLGLCRPRGRFLEIGKRGILTNESLPMGPFLRNVSFHSVQIDILSEDEPEVIQDTMEKVIVMLSSEKIGPIAMDVTPLTHFREAIRLASSGNTYKKTVFEIPPLSTSLLQEESIKLMLEMNLHTLRFNSEASYLITGGFGGLAMKLAEWLVALGARHLVLMSRGGPQNNSHHRFVRELEKKGAKIVIAKGDVSKEEDVKAVVQSIVLEGVPLKGIFHLPVVYADAFTVHLSTADFRKPLLPKLAGAWHLHNATLGMKLDYFITSSTISTLSGNLEQSNYLAANTFLDSFAAYRRGMGLPAHNIRLGAIRAAGYLERNRMASKIILSRGFKWLHVKDLLDSLECILPQSESFDVCLADLDFTHKVYTSGVDVMKWSHLIRTATSGGDNTLSRDQVVDRLLTQLANIFCMDKSVLSADEPVMNYGVDSLMAVEMVNWAKAELNISISQIDVLGGLSVNQLLTKAGLNDGSEPDAVPAA